MRTEALLDTPLATGTVTVEIRTEEPLGAPLVRFVESIFQNTSLVVSTQGLSTSGRDDAVLRVESFRTSQDGAGVVVELACGGSVFGLAGAERLLAARFEIWTAAEEAFHAAIRQLAYFQRRYGCIGAVEVR
ncbi:hypothetical protein ACFZAV_20220 [Streptomyces sp. NPDC008343]|uniref:hypothetical protein n=1 Tax=Streptomyces sp. NPDC008343 TaxID=3364828 RepID=UPI0036E44B7F